MNQISLKQINTEIDEQVKITEEIKYKEELMKQMN